MRIRKRFPLFSTPPCVSDPQLNHSTLVQQTSSSLLHPIHHNMDTQHNPITHSPPSDPSSDQKPVIVDHTLHPHHKFQIKHKEEEVGENGSNKTRKEYNFLALAPVGETPVLPPLGSHQVEGRWFDGDEKIPLKKRKEVVERKGEDTVVMSEEDKKMKSKTNKRCSTSGMQQSHSEQDDKAGNDDGSSTLNNNLVKKMNKRGGAIMEGSRCSRVNGRGWRCCQQTLVGYSLCEHHLGKGRLRSISNVKGRTKAPTVAATIIAPQTDATNNTTNDSTTIDNQSLSKKLVSISSSVVQSPRDRKHTILLDGSCYDEDEDENEEEDEDDDDYNEEETKKPPVARKKRMKVGMVKARSLSSLLNQTN